MDYTTVLGLMCVVSSCSIFLGYMAGHARAYDKGIKAGARQEAEKFKSMIENIYGKYDNGTH